MLDLSETETASWFKCVPPDIRAVIPAPLPRGREPDGETAELVAAVKAAMPGGAAGPAAFAVAMEMPALVRKFPQGIVDIGRAGRCRLLTWMLDSGGDNPGALLRQMVGEDDEGESGGDPVGILFLEDILALAGPIGARIARSIVEEQNLELANQAVNAVESEMVFRQGGV